MKDSLLSFLLIFGTAWVAPGTTHAVVLVGGDGSGNTTAPPDDPGFNNVGNRGVYLGNIGGNFWVLTAAHVGAGSINLAGTIYNHVAGSTVTISNPSGQGLSATTDLAVFRINSDPGLPNLSISSTAPAVGSNVTLIGDGLDREAAQISWHVDTSTNPFTWTEGGANPNVFGFKPAGTSTKRWGTNVLTAPGANQVIDVGFGDSRVLSMTFDQAGGDDEATLALGDSGGGLFHKNGSAWELAGILLAVGTVSGQPSNTSIFTLPAFSADLAFYRDEILSVTAVPEPSLTAAILAFGSLATVTGLRRSRKRRSGNPAH